MVTRHCQWRGANVPLSVASLRKHTNVSDVFTTVRLIDPTVMDRDQNEQEQMCYWQRRVYTVLHKDATASGTLPFVDFKIYFYHSYY
jgi:hypothetical protein